MLRIVEDGLPHQSADWFAMTVIFDAFRSKTDAKRNEKACHCEARRAVAIRIPCIWRMLGGHRPPHSPTPINDNLHAPAYKSGCPGVGQPLFIYFPQPQFPPQPPQPPQPLQFPEQEPLSGQPTHLTPFFRALRR